MRNFFFDPEVSATAPRRGEKSAEITMLRETANVKKDAPWRRNPRISTPFSPPATTVAKYWLKMTARMVVAKAELAKSYMAQPKISRLRTGMGERWGFTDPHLRSWTFLCQ